MSIEHLESRIAPATLAGNHLTYTDLDGDLVRLTFSHAVMDASNFVFSTGAVDGDSTTPQALTSINLVGKTGGGFQLTATPHGGKGDSHANIGTIDGAATLLGTISVDGDVRLLNAGIANNDATGLKSFTALSMGATGAGSNTSLYNVGNFTVKGDVRDEALFFQGTRLGKVTIGGNLIETLANTVTEILTDYETIASDVIIGGSVIAKSGGEPNLYFRGPVSQGLLKIGGSVIGGSKDLSFGFQIVGGTDFTNLTIGHDVIGGKGVGGGAVLATALHTLQIGGSVIAHDDVTGSGYILLASVDRLAIGGTLRAGDITGSNYIQNNGAIIIQGDAGLISIRGDFLGAHRTGSGNFDNSHQISVDGTLGKLTIGGSVLGDASAPITIGASAAGTSGTVQAIKSLFVKGSVERAGIVAGLNRSIVIGNTNSGIGSVKIGGTLAGSNLFAGVGAGADGLPGTSDDATIPGSEATIGRVQIGRAFTGVAGSNTLFQIYSPILNKLSVGKATYNHDALTNGVFYFTIGLAGALSDH